MTYWNKSCFKLIVFNEHKIVTSCAANPLHKLFSPIIIQSFYLFTQGTTSVRVQDRVGSWQVCLKSATLHQLNGILSSDLIKLKL